MPIQTVRYHKRVPAGLLGIHPHPTLDRIRPNPETPTQLKCDTRLSILCFNYDLLRHYTVAAYYHPEAKGTASAGAAAVVGLGRLTPPNSC